MYISRISSSLTPERFVRAGTGFAVDVKDGLNRVEGRDVIVTPSDDESNLRYSDWEDTRRLQVEEKGAGKIGYVHLRAMGGRDINAWYREFYPVFNRQGLILDFRHKRGGNTDSIILEPI